MSHQRVVEYQRGKDFAEKRDIPFIEISVKTGDNVEEAMLTLPRLLIANRAVTRTPTTTTTGKSNKVSLVGQNINTGRPVCRI
jgi:hypothetical protein